MANIYAKHKAREFALQGIYQHLMSQNSAFDIEQTMNSVKGFDKADQAFYSQLLRGTIHNRETLESLFTPYLKRPIDQLSPIEHAILLLAAHELNTCPETPYRVIINESIELTKSYGGSDGHKFVNGVLDKLAEQMRKLEFQAPQPSA